MTREAAGELQPLLHSTSDSMIRKLVVANDTTIDMDAAQVKYGWTNSFAVRPRDWF